MRWNGLLNRTLHLLQLVNVFYFKCLSFCNLTDLQDLIVAIEAGDEDQFLDKLQAYDAMSKLDRWKTAMFLKVKEGIDAEPDLT